MPGAAVQCERCATAIAVTYPSGVIEQLRARGKRFADDDSSRAASHAGGGGSDLASVGPSPRRSGSSAMPPRAAPPPPPRMTQTPPTANGRSAGPREEFPSDDASTEVGHDTDGDHDAFHRSGSNGAYAGGYGGSNGVGTRGAASGSRGSGGRVPAPDRTTTDDDESVFPTERAPMVRNGSTPSPSAKKPGSTPKPAPGARSNLRPDGGSRSPAQMPTIKQPRMSTPRPPAPRSAPRKGRLGALTGAVGCLGSVGVLGLGGLALAAVVGVLVAMGGYWYIGQQLPTVEKLQGYSPPTVTVVTDRNGQMMGEIFEEKRYVTPIDQIPDHVKNAFLAAEDANFYTHGGVDFFGIFRAVIRNTLSGQKAQGASTITQQVARNSFLTKEKTYTRKLKEIILSWRIEEAYDKDHILFLYLNEVFLGAQSYGVEAASRTYFAKHVQDITIAEAAILAGLPQRPSVYTPYKGWSNARARQEYVIGQMEDKGFITSEQAKAALAEDVKIATRENKFRSKAPYFTEHVRRYLVEKYGEERVLHEGLNVQTTCDLELQTLAQASVKAGVYETDMRMGYRRKGVTNVGKGNIEKTREELEKKMRESWAEEQDPAGRVEVPAKSVLEEGRIYDAVITEVGTKYAKFGIGAHDAMLPISWGDWIYEPDPSRSWRGRAASDFTARVDGDGDGKRDSPILMPGDMVKVRVEALSAKDPKVAKAFSNYSVSADTVAVKIFQVPEVEAALISMDVETGAVRAMVGGSDFDKSEFNRTVQARRQVGSTFKPIVYAAAIESKRVTTATMVADAPLAMATADEFVWKPTNYSADYEGNMTMRTALMKSKNTCTVRILEAADPGMNQDVVYKFARELGIGGPPTHTLPEDWVPTPKNDVLCPWVKERPDSTICMDRWPAKDPSLTDAAHRAQLRSSGKEHWCRACDMSMGLGSASLTMEEMIRAYSAFASGGKLVQPYYVEKVEDRSGNVLEQHEVTPHAQVMDPAVASITTWLMEGVTNGGTASQAGRELGLNGLAGKTGTTNDEKDAWFVGFTNDVITAVWFGYDQPQTLGVSSTGGRTALPVWIEYMKAAAPRKKDRPFPIRGNVQFALIDEASGRRVTSGGVSYPFLEGTVPEDSGLKEGEVSLEDMSGGGL